MLLLAVSCKAQIVNVVWYNWELDAGYGHGPSDIMTDLNIFKPFVENEPHSDWAQVCQPLRVNKEHTWNRRLTPASQP